MNTGSVTSSTLTYFNLYSNTTLSLAFEPQERATLFLSRAADVLSPAGIGQLVRLV